MFSSLLSFPDETLSIKNMLPKDNFTQSQTTCSTALLSSFIHNPDILLEQKSCFLDTSNTLPLSPFPQVGHAFLLRQCHSYVQVGSRSCAACHRSFCRSFGKEAWWLVKLLVGEGHMWLVVGAVVVDCWWSGGWFVACWWVWLFSIDLWWPCGWSLVLWGWRVGVGCC